MVSILSVENLHKRFLLGSVVVDALNGVSLQVDEGAFVGIVGRSGSGKSTLLNLIGGLDKPTSGSIMTIRRLGGKKNRKVSFWVTKPLPEPERW